MKAWVTGPTTSRGLKWSSAAGPQSVNPSTSQRYVRYLFSFAEEDMRDVSCLEIRWNTKYGEYGDSANTLTVHLILSLRGFPLILRLGLPGGVLIKVLPRTLNHHAPSRRYPLMT